MTHRHHVSTLVIEYIKHIVVSSHVDADQLRLIMHCTIRLTRYIR